MIDIIQQLSDALSSDDVRLRNESAEELSVQLERAIHYKIPLPLSLLRKVVSHIQLVIQNERDSEARQSLLLALYEGLYLFLRSEKNWNLLWLKDIFVTADDEEKNYIIMILSLDDDNWSYQMLTESLEDQNSDIVESARNALNERQRRNTI